MPAGTTKNIPGVKRVATGIAGGTMVAAGVAMLVLPGPGLLTIALGLALLATEFAWAEGLLKKARAAITRQKKD